VEAIILRHLGTGQPATSPRAGALTLTTRTPRISWHRGGGEIAPSASRAAFLTAAEHSAECIEVDVRRTADGVLVCVHDPVVPHLGAVSELRWADLDAAARDSVLTLETFLDDLAGADPANVSVVHLDLKDAGYEIDAVDALLGRGRPMFVTTSVVESIATVRSERPDVPAFLTIGQSHRGLDYLTSVAQLASELIPLWSVRRSRATGVAVHYALATRGLRWWCRRRGLAVVVWTVDDDDQLRTWLSRRIDVITTNRPLAALALRDGAMTEAQR
jgi:glycerophosphoryl diester phosphodiesterase